VPRRETSRSRVPPGSVALAADYCGVYPRESPGGWQLIGRTDATLWDTRRDLPALVTAGTRVRFTPVLERDRVISQESRHLFAGRSAHLGGHTSGTPEHRNGGSALRVLDAGPLTLVQDLGRTGLATLGVGRSGAFDRAAHRLANRLVGNVESAASLEVLLGGAAIALPAGTWFAVTGAEGPVTLDDVPVPTAHAVRAEREGAVLRFGLAANGLRYTVAVRGGVDVEPTLGSRARDTLSALGPRPLAAGDTLWLGKDTAGPVPAVDLVPVDAPGHNRAELAVRPGPRRDWFTDEAWNHMLQTAWTVSARSDRTGVRLDGAELERRAETAGRELPSEGMLPGAIQVSPDGVPTILGPDHPVTGGYPVIAVVTANTLDRLAQVRPGQRVRLRLATGRR
jgi:biotin-dependent carboxylase-like uncharacterized protein